MIQQIRKFITPPIFSDDDDKTRIAHTLHVVLLAISITVLAALIGSMLFAQQKIGSAAADLAVLGSNYLAFRLSRKGKVYLAARWLIIYSWLIVTIYVFSTGPLNLSSSLYLPVIAMAALFLGWQASVVTTGFTFAYLLFLVIADQLGNSWPRLFPLPGIFGWMLFMFSTALVLIPLLSMRNELLKALLTARTQLAERQKVEEALRQSEERYRLISSVSSDYTFSSRFDEHGNLVHTLLTGAFESIMGYTAEEFMAIGGWRSTVYPDDLPEDDRAMATLRQNKQAVSEVRTIKKGGVVRWVRVYAHPVWDAEKSQLVAINGAVQDITDRKLTEQSLKESETRFRNLFESAPYLIGVSTLSALCLDVNPAWLKWGNWSADEVIGKSLLQSLGITMTVYEHFDQKMSVQGELNHEELIVQHKDGELHTLLFSARYVTFAGEQCVLTNAIDVTERKQTEANIRELNRDLHRQTRQLTALNEINRDIATMTTLNETLHSVLEKLKAVVPLDSFFIALHDTSTKSVSYPVLYESGHFSDTHVSSPEENAITMKVLESGTSVLVNRSAEEMEEQRQAQRALGDSSRSSASILYAPLTLGKHIIGVISVHSFTANEYNESHVGLLTAVAYQIGIAVYNARLYDTIQRELTERKHAEHEIRELNAELEQRVAERTHQHQAALQELQAFTYSVSHDLRAPLRAIDGFSKTLEHEYSAELPPKAQHYLSRVQVNVQHMGELVDDLLLLARIGRIAVKREHVDMNLMVQQVYEELKTEIDLERVELKVHELPPTEADPGLLKQVLNNLLSNAIKYTSQRAQPQIEMGATLHNGQTTYFIRDNGIGFDMRYVNKLFGVFQKLHSDENYEGTGIGLATVQRIVAAHGGRVWAEGEVDKGATFFFSLPQ